MYTIRLFLQETPLWVAWDFFYGAIPQVSTLGTLVNHFGDWAEEALPYPDLIIHSCKIQDSKYRNGPNTLQLKALYILHIWPSENVEMNASVNQWPVFPWSFVCLHDVFIV